MVVLTYNRWDRTARFLDSLVRARGLSEVQLVWLDNGSTDETPSMMSRFLARHRELFGDIVELKNGENNGFLGGVNQAVSHCTRQQLCLVNNDTVVPENCIVRLRSLLDTADGVGAVGPVSDGMPFEQLYDPRRRPDICRASVVYGFCLVTWRVMFDIVGLLDERYGRGVVEVEDWCNRVSSLGFSFAIDAGVVVKHDEPHASYSKRTNALLTVRNRNLFRQKWGRGPYHWDGEFRPVQRSYFTRTRVLVDRAPTIESVREDLSRMDPGEELLVIRHHTNSTEHLELPRWSREEHRLQVICVAQWPPRPMEIGLLAGANRRSDRSFAAGAVDTALYLATGVETEGR